MNNKKINTYSTISETDYQPKKDRSFKFILLTVICFFLGYGLCIGFYAVTLIDFVNFSKFIVGFAVIGFLIPLKFYGKWFHFVKYEVIIFNVMGIAPILAGLFLFINFSFSSQPYTHDYKIEKIYFEGEEKYQSMGVILEENFFSGERKIVELSNVNPSEILFNSHFRVTISKGLFGFDVINNREFVK